MVGKQNDVSHSWHSEAQDIFLVVCVRLLDGLKLYSGMAQTSQIILHVISLYELNLLTEPKARTITWSLEQTFISVYFNCKPRKICLITSLCPWSCLSCMIFFPFLNTSIPCMLALKLFLAHDNRKTVDGTVWSEVVIKIKSYMIQVHMQTYLEMTFK